MDGKTENKILITNIQRFSLHDGPGIRTTVFLKGCSLHCPWCSNPENLLYAPQAYNKDGIEGVYGKWYSVDELVKEVLKDRDFYGGKLLQSEWNICTEKEIEMLPGGVTFSGGECLLQMDRLVPVCHKLHEKKIHMAAETSLFVSRADLELALKYIDLFYADVKILDTEQCSKVEHGNLACYLTNLDILFKSMKPVIIRIPVIGGYTDGEENRKAIRELLEKYKRRILKIELIKEHNLGESKYKSLGLSSDYHGVEDGLLEIYKEELKDVGVTVEVCRI